MWGDEVGVKDIFWMKELDFNEGDNSLSQDGTLMGGIVERSRCQHLGIELVFDVHRGARGVRHERFLIRYST